MPVDCQALLARRAAVAEEMTQAIGRLGVLVREEQELQDRLRRGAEAAGSRANPFATAATVMDAICSELTRAGLSPHRADPAVRLADLVDHQNRRYRGHVAGRVGGPAAA
jgi:hypothetical protein